jgi:uncharacterized RDD family membrane protein YckC
VPGPSDAQAPAAQIPSGTGRFRGLPIALVRGLQFAVDFAMSALLCILPMAVVLVLPRNPDGTLGDLLVSIPVIGLAMVASVALSWWYWSRLPVRRGGRTLAMGWFGLQVVGEGGQPVGTATMALRWLGLLVDAMLFGLVGLASMLLTPRTQRVGDLLAATFVVRADALATDSVGPVATSPSEPAPPSETTPPSEPAT